MDIEIWRNLVGYELFYEISNLGRIRGTRKNKIMTPYLDVRGYSNINLFNGGDIKHYKVHRLVALTFIENPLNKKYINHINSNRCDNRAINLEWCTVKENNRLSKNIDHINKFNMININDMYNLYQDGKSIQDIGKQYNVGKHVIQVLLYYLHPEY